MQLNCVVVENNEIKPSILVKLIEAHPLLYLLELHHNTTEAKNIINISKMDVLFITIEMTGLNAFKLIDTLNYKSQIIFISDQTEHAISAFDYNATDYLVKPLNEKRFNSAIKKAIDYHKYISETKRNKQDFIFVKSNLKKQKVYIKDIKWIEALGDYIKVITEDKSLVVLSTMKYFESLLPKNKFLRIHKSFIVSTDRIECYNSKHVEIDAHLLPLSRNKKVILETILNTY